jgi:holo-ACP synthase
VNAAIHAATGGIVSLEQVLEARDQLAASQAAALSRFQIPVVSMTTVTPGPVKDSPLSRRVLLEALRVMTAMFNGRNWPVLSCNVRWSDAGPQAICVVDVEPERLRLATVDLEDQHPLGRLWGLDVIAPGHRILSREQFGFPGRHCLLCERRAAECGRSRRHALSDLLEVIQKIVNSYEQHKHPRGTAELTTDGAESKSR